LGITQTARVLPSGQVNGLRSKISESLYRSARNMVAFLEIAKFLPIKIFKRTRAENSSRQAAKVAKKILFLFSPNLAPLASLRD
jgi:hypothetical protein